MLVDADHVKENGHQTLQVAKLHNMALPLLLCCPVEHRTGGGKVHAYEPVASNGQRHTGAQERLERLQQRRGIAIDITFS